MARQSIIELKTPLEDVRRLKVGDLVKISGVIYTARDRAHQYLLEENPNFNLKNSAIYHCGPIVRKTGKSYEVVGAGPTTSSRMNVYEPEVIGKYKIKAIIGKGGMDSRTLRAMGKFGCVYLSVVGGLGALTANSIVMVREVHKLEFGIPEAIWELEVQDLPAIVTMDTKGNSLHENVLKSSEIKYKKLLGK